MSVEDGDSKQPKSVIMHHLDPVKKFQIKMGVTDFNEDYDHFLIHEHNARLIRSLYDLIIAERLINLHYSLVDSLIKAT